MRLKLFASVLVVISMLLTACETMMSSNRVVVSAAERWALLPIENLSSTPLAGNQARSLVETHLRARGVQNLELFEVGTEQTLMALLDEAGQLAAAKQWAVDNGFRYGITGNVQEWQYKNGLDNEPSVGLTLKFVDLQEDSVMWVASASRTGWGYQNLSSVASKTIGDLLSEVRFKQPSERERTRRAALADALPKLPTTLRPLDSIQPLPTIGAALPRQEIPTQEIQSTQEATDQNTLQPVTGIDNARQPKMQSPFENSLLEPTNR